LFIGGVVFAGLAGALGGASFRIRPVVLAVLLVLAILLYDSYLKHTPIGPVGMGLCRFLNVLLGLSVVPVWPGAWGLVLALVVGLYIVGVTWFARREAQASNWGELIGASAVMLVALLLALAVPVLGRPASRGDTSDVLVWAQVALGQLLFPYLLVAFG